MGLIIDSSGLVIAERRGLNAKQALVWLSAQVAEEDMALSVISVMELSHGISRSRDAKTRETRTKFLRDLQMALQVYPVTAGIAARAGRIDAACAVAGKRIATADLLIAATALHLGFGVATHNLRHFHAVSGLDVLSLSL